MDNGGNSRLQNPVDQKQVWRQFARAAKRGVVDPLSREIDQRMLERLDYVRIEPAHILDLGAGSGKSTSALQNRYPQAQLILLDAVQALLPPQPAFRRNWLHRWLPPSHTQKPLLTVICGDARQLPIPSDQLDLVWSNMLLPWIDDVSLVMNEAYRTLKTNGLLMFSSLGPNTLQTLAACFKDNFPHCQIFPDMHDLGDLLVQTGFADPVMDMETVSVEYSSVSSLINDLRMAAANCAHQERRKGMMGRNTWLNMLQNWSKLATQHPSQKVSIQFEIVYGHAWKSRPNQLSDGRQIINFKNKQGGLRTL